MSKSCATPGQEPAASSLRDMTCECPVCQAGCAETLLVCQWLCRGSSPRPCGRCRLYNSGLSSSLGSRNLLGLPAGGPLLSCCSAPFDLATSLGADLFKLTCSGPSVPLEGSACLDGLVTDSTDPASSAWPAMVEYGDGTGQCSVALGLQSPGRGAASSAGLYSSSSVSSLVLAAEHPTQSTGRCHFEQRQAPAEGLLTPAKTCLAQR